MLLGYTRRGIEVWRPTLDDPIVDFGGWTREDHVDAARILTENSEREDDSEIESLCWKRVKLHRDIAKLSRRPNQPMLRIPNENSVRLLRSRVTPNPPSGTSVRTMRRKK